MSPPAPDRAGRELQTELFENAFHFAPIGMALVDLDGRFLKVNQGFAALVGLSVEALLACDVQQITHPDDLDQDRILLAQLTAGDIPSYQMDKRYIRRDGVVVWANLSVSMVSHPDGRPRHYVAQVQDITERKAMETRYRLMAEHATDMIVVWNLREGVTFASAASSALIGIAPSEMLGSQPPDVVHPDDLAVVEDGLRRVRAGEVGVQARWRPLRGPAGRWIESRWSLLPADREELNVVSVARDVTAQVLQEQALEAARLQAETAAVAKSEFVADMSHEIRTPLTAVLGFASRLAQSPRLDLADRHAADRLQSAGQSLMSVVNNVLDYSRIEDGQIELSPHAADVRLLTNEVLALFETAARAKGLRLSVQASPQTPLAVILDSDRLRQVLINLVANAVNYTDAGSVTARLDYRDNQLSVAVEDTGIGLDPSQAAQLFQRYGQLQQGGRRRVGGTGLGLFISRGLVRAMGGELDVTSRLGSGSVFSFSVFAPAA